MHTAYAYSVSMSVRMGLLALLSEGDSYGYQLRSSFEAATGSLWPLNVGQVYSTLDRLESADLVRSEERPSADGSDPQRWYALTPEGRNELEAWFDAPEVDEVPPRDGLQAKVLLSLVAGPEVALEVVARQRTALTGVLQRRRASQRRRARERSAAEAPDLPPPLVAIADDLVDEAVIARTEAALRWLDLCDAKITEAVRSRTVPTGRKQ